MSSHRSGGTPVACSCTCFTCSCAALHAVYQPLVQCVPHADVCATHINTTGEKLLTTRASRPDGSTIATFQHWATQRHQEHMMGFRRARLRRILLDKAQEMGTQLQLGHRLSAITHGQQGTSAVLQFENGASHEFQLVVGCDGIHSRTRALLKGSAQEPPPR